MVVTKSGDVTKQRFCKILWRKLRLREGLLLSVIWVCVGGSGVGLRAYSRLGAHSRLGAYSNKYGIQLDRRALLALCYWSAGTDLVVLTFQQLLDCKFFSFLFSFFYFFFVIFYCIFETYFSIRSPVSLTFPSPAAPPLLQTRGNDHFVLLQIIPSTIPRSWLTQNCGLKDFALIDVLVSWKL